MAPKNIHILIPVNVLCYMAKGIKVRNEIEFANLLK